MSLTVAQNPIPKDKEGLTLVRIQDRWITLLEAVETSEKEILGDYRKHWPLTKILDIGGKQVTPSFPCECQESPGIPCHVHSGILAHDENGKPYMKGPGKLEAYFFPPLNLQDEKVVTRYYFGS